MKYFYLPIEFASREIDGYCKLAVTALNKDIKVIVMPRFLMYDYLESFPPGVFLLKNIRLSEYNDILRLKKNGSKVAYLDQEGLIHYPHDFSSGRKFSPVTLELCDYFFANSEEHLYELQRTSSSRLHDRITLTGNPRFEFCQNNAIDYYCKNKEKHLLFTTSFGNVNSFSGKGSNQYLKMIDGLSGEIDKTEEYKRIELNVLMIDEYSRLLQRLATSLPRMKIILRPHLSEGNSFWKKVSNGLDNVIIQADGPIYDLLANSFLHIHFNSTTAIEAAMMGIPTSTYEIPEKYSSLRLDDCFLVSSIFDSETEFVEYVDKLFRSSNYVVKKIIQKQHNGSSQHMVDLLDFPVSDEKLTPKVDIKHKLIRVYKEIKDRLRHINFSTAYKYKKVDGLKFNEVDSRINYLNHIDSNIDYNLRQFAPMSFIIEKE